MRIANAAIKMRGLPPPCRPIPAISRTIWVTFLSVLLRLGAGNRYPHIGDSVLSHETADAAAAFPLSRVLENEADLRAVYRRPRDTVVAKNIRHIDDHFRRFIGLSPFYAWARRARTAEATPRPAAASRDSFTFWTALISRCRAVRVIIASTVSSISSSGPASARAPDAPLNAELRSSFLFVHRIYPKSAHTFRSDALVFLIPGFEDALRVNGTARITTDEALMSRFIVDGKPPSSPCTKPICIAARRCGAPGCGRRRRRSTAAHFRAPGRSIAISSRSTRRWPRSMRSWIRTCGTRCIRAGLM